MQMQMLNWSSWGEFAAMGGYALYVWGSFGLTALLLLAEVMALRVRRRALRQLPRPTRGGGFGETPHEA